MLTFEEGGRIALYNGSYTEYFQEKGERLWGEESAVTESAAKKDSDKGNEAVGAEQKSSMQEWKEQKSQMRKLKFTYNEQKEYDTIEADIEALEQKLDMLEQEMGKAATDFVKLNQLTKEKEETEAKLEEKMERFVYLSELADKIAAQ